MRKRAIQPAAPQEAEPERRKRRARRISDVMPTLRERITPLFDRGVSVDRLAVDLGIPPVQVLEHVVREYAGAKHPGPVLIERRPVASGVSSVRAFRQTRLSA